MNLQGENIFFEESEAAKKGGEPSKVKQNLENAKKLDREIPYSSNPREAYSHIQYMLIGTPKNKAKIIKHEWRFLSI